MKKLLALTLALTLACSLCVPALAAEDEDVHVVYGEEAAEILENAANDGGELKSIADESPEVQAFLQEMYDEGLLQEGTDHDLSYFEDGGETDPVAQYIANHPEEMAALDPDALLAGWGYPDPREEFMDDWSDKGETFEEMVAWYYADNRVGVLSDVALAEEYKAQYPDAWADFDPDAYFEAGVSFSSYYFDTKEELMAASNLLTQEEFAAYLFVEYIDDVYPDDWRDEAETGEPTLTLVVNGVASDVVIQSNDWTTYADAAALRDILGVQAVAPTYEGPVPVREAAENAGWEVEWYDGGWWGIDQQVCLWNKDAFVAEIAPQVEPFQKLWDAAMASSRSILFTEEPKRSTETTTVTFKRFNSLDGDKTCNLKLRAESVWQKGVLDCTVTFDVSQLLGIFTDDELESMAQDAELSLGDLKALFSAGKAEFIIDYNVGGMAYNIPLLGLMDEDLEGWQTTYIPGLGETLTQSDSPSYAEMLYENMVEGDMWLSGVRRRENVDDALEALSIFAGPDNVQATGSTVTYTLETDKVNAALSKLIGDGDKTFSFFKKCDINMTFDAQGKSDLTLALRPDIDGIVEASMTDSGETNALLNSLLRWFLGGLDMELTATTHSDRAKGAETLKLHIKNFGVFDVNSQSTTKSAAQGPRQLAEVERTWVTPAAGATVTVAR